MSEPAWRQRVWQKRAPNKLLLVASAPSRLTALFVGGLLKRNCL